MGSNRRRTSSPQYQLTSVSFRKLDSACCRGEPAGKWRSPRRMVREDTGASHAIRPTVSPMAANPRYRIGTARGGWRQNGRKISTVKQGDLPGTKAQAGQESEHP